MKLPRRPRLLYVSRIMGTLGSAMALAAPTASDAAEIKVLTSRAMNHVLTELAGAFQRTSEHKIAIILAPPVEIRRRVVNGETVDVAMSSSAEMARGYSSSRQRVAGRKDSFWNPRRRKNYSSLNDQCLAEKAIRAENA